MEKDAQTIAGWFAGRLPEGWFSGTEVTVEGDQVIVIGRLADLELAPDASAEMRAGAAAGRITRFREETRGQRIAIAREAEHKFEKHVTWGASLGDVSERFTPGGSGRGGDQSPAAKSVMIARRRRMARAWARRFASPQFGPESMGRRFGMGLRRRWHRSDGPQVY
jgi:hypothetical protein